MDKFDKEFWKMETTVDKDTEAKLFVEITLREHMTPAQSETDRVI